MHCANDRHDEPQPIGDDVRAAQERPGNERQCVVEDGLERVSVGRCESDRCSERVVLLVEHLIQAARTPASQLPAIDR